MCHLLPAHFLTDSTGITSEESEDILPGYSTFYSPSFREVFPYLLASLVHYHEYLCELQGRHPRHPLFLQRVWTSGILIRLKDKVGTGCSMNPISKLVAMSVPPHLVLANRTVTIENSNWRIEHGYRDPHHRIAAGVKEQHVTKFSCWRCSAYDTAADDGPHGWNENSDISSYCKWSWWV